jgi:cellulose biosynthesis protein BcsQ
MANIAVLLAKYGKSVLLMDWDLEAPGLDRYFKPYIKTESKSSQGLIHMLAKAAKEAVRYADSDRALSSDLNNYERRPIHGLHRAYPNLLLVGFLRKPSRRCNPRSLEE